MLVLEAPAPSRVATRSSTAPFPRQRVLWSWRVQVTQESDVRSPRMSELASLERARIGPVQVSAVEHNLPYPQSSDVEGWAILKAHADGSQQNCYIRQVRTTPCVKELDRPGSERARGKQDAQAAFADVCTLPQDARRPEPGQTLDPTISHVPNFTAVLPGSIGPPDPMHCLNEHHQHRQVRRS